ncbi:hypothetical protein [Ferroacidibacillus organovorans]|uniref:Uncharacterized protein n=1 Tax=Ferroacidibacillus organovorans TaxID=1765683 RepID=A0A162TJA2_9BACL|nr:hypothetical protein [Ferroacidibacillus organovorans]KYP80862.1 hypothetical protein AYJ22_01520 [Ferroacidibacillus organovorans]OAG95407.1 hypothetical protein AYW79_00400 [Ferroacidibacillus organovorans]OPG15756.1 hypothetical protein B2M26_09040 [Ferroacidibacillus organovorans]
MAAFVSVGAFQVASVANDVGFFYGQNVQNAWDSHAPLQMGAGFTMGNYDLMNNAGIVSNTPAAVLQPINDQDVKDNFSPSWQGP